MKLIIVVCVFLASIAISSSLNISMDVQLTYSYKATLYSDGKKNLDPESIPSLTTSAPELVHNLKSCAEIFRKGITKSGIYTIFPKIEYNITSFKVYCDMETSGGGWTVFQRRDDYKPRENFTRNWQDYKTGFGDLEKEFWLGNDHIFVLTNQDDTVLRIDLEDNEKDKRWAQYPDFQMKNEENSYLIAFSGHSGNVGDKLRFKHRYNPFSTYDRDGPKQCARDYKGGWWYNNHDGDCYDVNLNGVDLKANNETGIVWRDWSGYYHSLKKSEMKIRPTNF